MRSPLLEFAKGCGACRRNRPNANLRRGEAQAEEARAGTEGGPYLRQCGAYRDGIGLRSRPSLSMREGLTTAWRKEAVNRCRAACNPVDRTIGFRFCFARGCEYWGHWEQDNLRGRRISRFGDGSRERFSAAVHQGADPR